MNYYDVHTLCRESRSEAPCRAHGNNVYEPPAGAFDVRGIPLMWITCTAVRSSHRECPQTPATVAGAHMVRQTQVHGGQVPRHSHVTRSACSKMATLC